MITNKLTIGYFYKDLLNLYGDNGNVEVLAFRAKKRGIEVVVKEITITTAMLPSFVEDINLVFMGGGPDSSQLELYKDLKNNKSNFLNQYINLSGVGLFICGAYQLLGKYYKSSNGEVLPGLDILDIYTEHFGNKKPRCIGNTLACLDKRISEDAVFKNNTFLGDEITGFENHGGRTYLGPKAQAFAKTIMGNGNNSEDLSEGVHFKNSIGTYFHGPFLARNPHVADYLILKALKTDKFITLQDKFVVSAYTASKKYKQ